MPSTVDFPAVNASVLPLLPVLVRRWLPNGRRCGNEWVALNPLRDDKHVGSFRINLVSGRWADFATGDQGGDVISLASYLGGISQAEAARNLKSMLGMH